MTEKQIVCTELSEDQNHIVKVGCIDPITGNKNKATERLDAKNVANQIKQGIKFYFTNESNKKVYVGTYENDKYLRTNPDNVENNNLRELRICNFK